MASMYGAIFGLLAEMGGCGSCCIGVIAELNGCCSSAPGPGQAADLLCSGQYCDLFERQDTHFSAWGPLPVHTIISDGAAGFAGSLGRVAAAALFSSGHSDLLAASAAKATEYMLEPAAASVAAFADDVLDTLLLDSGALACGYLFFENDLHAAAALFGKFLGVPFSKCVSEFELVSSGNAGNWFSGFFATLLCILVSTKRPWKSVAVNSGQGEAKVHS